MIPRAGRQRIGRRPGRVERISGWKSGLRRRCIRSDRWAVVKHRVQRERCLRMSGMSTADRRGNGRCLAEGHGAVIAAGVMLATIHLGRAHFHGGRRDVDAHQSHLGLGRQGEPKCQEDEQDDVVTEHACCLSIIGPIDKIGRVGPSFLRADCILRVWRWHSSTNRRARAADDAYVLAGQAA